MDAFYLGIGTAFFTVAWGLIEGLTRLEAGRS